MEQLFGDFERSRVSLSSHRESTYNFLNESAWKWVEYFRNVVDKWYLDFPKDQDFYSKFTGKDDINHASVFFELFMYSLCRCMNYHVKYHQSIGSRLIDLTLINGNRTILADCTLSGDPLSDSSNISNIKGEIQDIVTNINSPNYFVSLYFISSSVRTPKLGRLRSKIEEEIKLLSLVQGETKTFVWEAGDWIIQIALLKKKFTTDQTSPSVRSSGTGGFTDGLSMSILRRSLNEKRGSLYNVKGPYLIAVNISNITITDELIKGTLYGRLPIKGYNNDLFLEQAFFFENQPQNTLVSGIILIKGLHPSNMGAVHIEIWENPWAQYPLSSELNEITRYSPVLNEYKEIEEIKITVGKKTHEILKIKEHYLNDDFE